jgi:hypothetical protein
MNIVTFEHFIHSIKTSSLFKKEFSKLNGYKRFLEAHTEVVEGVKTISFNSIHSTSASPQLTTTNSIKMLTKVGISVFRRHFFCSCISLKCVGTKSSLVNFIGFWKEKNNNIISTSQIRPEILSPYFPKKWRTFCAPTTTPTTTSLVPSHSEMTKTEEQHKQKEQSSSYVMFKKNNK